MGLLFANLRKGLYSRLLSIFRDTIKQFVRKILPINNNLVVGICRTRDKSISNGAVSVAMKMGISSFLLSSHI